MKQMKSRYIKRDGKYVWLTHELPLEEGDELVEERPMLVADEGKVLYRNGELIGGAAWVKDGDFDSYVEGPIPPDEQEETETNTTEEKGGEDDGWGSESEI